MPIDEIDFAVSCSATVTDEFELQLTKARTKDEIEWKNFKTDWRKTILKRAFAHSRVSGDEIENTFVKIEWIGDENGRENIYYYFLFKLLEFGFSSSLSFYNYYEKQKKWPTANTARFRFVFYFNILYQYTKIYIW